MKKNKQKLYKVLVDGRSCHGGKMEWSLPKKKDGKWIPGKWHKAEGDIEVCSTGLHLTTERFKWYKWGCTAYEAEADMTEESWKDDKVTVRKCRLLKEVKHPKWWIDTENWCKTLKEISWMKPDGKPKKEWKLFSTRAAAVAAARAAAWDSAWDSAWDAAWAAARAAARAAAGDAAWAAAGAAAWAAAGAAAGDAAGDAVWDAAGAAAWAAARAAAGDSAWDAAWAAAGDAKIYGYSIVAEWNFETKHQTHIKKRMEVWAKGYGLLCDVNGVLYVYEKI